MGSARLFASQHRHVCHINLLQHRQLTNNYKNYNNYTFCKKRKKTLKKLLVNGKQKVRTKQKQETKVKYE